MKIKIVKIFYDAISFEFRTSQVSNWIKINSMDETVDNEKTFTERVAGLYYNQNFKSVT